MNQQFSHFPSRQNNDGLLSFGVPSIENNDISGVMEQEKQEKKQTIDRIFGVGEEKYVGTPWETKESRLVTQSVAVQAMSVVSSLSQPKDIDEKQLIFLLSRGVFEEFTLDEINKILEFYASIRESIKKTAIQLIKRKKERILKNYEDSIKILTAYKSAIDISEQSKIPLAIMLKIKRDFKEMLHEGATFSITPEREEEFKKRLGILSEQCQTCEQKLKKIGNRGQNHPCYAETRKNLERVESMRTDLLKAIDITLIARDITSVSNHQNKIHNLLNDKKTGDISGEMFDDLNRELDACEKRLSAHTKMPDSYRIFRKVCFYLTKSREDVEKTHLRYSILNNTPHVSDFSYFMQSYQEVAYLGNRIIQDHQGKIIFNKKDLRTIVTQLHRCNEIFEKNWLKMFSHGNSPHTFFSEDFIEGLSQEPIDSIFNTIQILRELERKMSNIVTSTGIKFIRSEEHYNQKIYLEKAVFTAHNAIQMIIEIYRATAL